MFTVIMNHTKVQTERKLTPAEWLEALTIAINADRPRNVEGWLVGKYAAIHYTTDEFGNLFVE